MRFCETWMSVLDATFLLCSWQAFVGTVGLQSCFCSRPEDGGCVPSQECDPFGNCNKVNVAYGKEASISSVYNKSNMHTGPACLAVNGRIGTVMKYLEESGTNCVHSLPDTDSRNQWWQVDLAANYTITDIIIYNRNGAGRRLAGIWIYVDNKICFQFPNSNQTALNSYLQKVVNITCQQPLRGRYIRFSKDGYTAYQDSFLNFCEVQVWVCRPGLFSETCVLPCSGHCLNNATCDNVNGFCLDGCAVGYHGNACFQRCDLCNNKVCAQLSGHCLHGCQVPGLAPPLCNPCIDRTYGGNCSQKCGHCANSTSCDIINGHCVSCDGNFTMPLCQENAQSGPNQKEVQNDVTKGLAWPIAGSLFAGLFVCAVSILVVGVCRRRLRLRKSRTGNNNTPQASNQDSRRSSQVEQSFENTLPELVHINNSLATHQEQEETHGYDRTVHYANDTDDKHVYSQIELAGCNGYEEISPDEPNDYVAMSGDSVPRYYNI